MHRRMLDMYVPLRISLPFDIRLHITKVLKRTYAHMPSHFTRHYGFSCYVTTWRHISVMKYTRHFLHKHPTCDTLGVENIDRCAISAHFPSRLDKAFKSLRSLKSFPLMPFCRWESDIVGGKGYTLSENYKIDVSALPIRLPYFLFLSIAHVVRVPL